MGELEFEEGVEEALEGEEVASQKTPFFTKGRSLVFSTIILFVFLIGAGLFWLRTGESPKKRSDKQAEAKVSSESAPPEKKKKKKVKYTVLYMNLPGEQTASILRELSFSHIPFSTQAKGKNFDISVAEDKLEEAKNLLAIKGLPGGGPKGYSLLDVQQTLGVTEFDKRVRFLRALSGELETAITQFEMIDSAKVQIVLPEQRLFALTQPPVTASILIRKAPDGIITDDVVFSIIQLVSNAVENLQPENVSVITTEGYVLSTGIFERMAARQSGFLMEEPGSKFEKPAPENVLEMGQPFIPDFTTIRQWYDIKRRYERTLEEKTKKQLIGILPAGSFKVAITADLGQMENAEIIDVRRLSVSVVADNNNPDVLLDILTKKMIFNTVAGAVGFVKGRDFIEITQADFSLFSPEEQRKMQGKSLASLKKISKWVLVILLFSGLVILLRKGIKQWRNRTKKRSVFEKEFEREPDFGELKIELAQEKQVDRIRDIATINPKLLAALMEEWLETEKVVEGV